LELCDGVLINRGLLSMEISFAEICAMQKEIIDYCNAHNKIVIVATQFLETMVAHP
jgi:pyruvate kinase